MSVGIKEDIQEYLTQDEIRTRLLVVIEYDEDNIYRFIANGTEDNVEICGETYRSAPIVRGTREENSDNSIESISLTLSNIWQEWAAIVANHGNEFLGKKCTLLEWFPDYPDEIPVPMYDGVLDEIKMNASTFEMSIVRTLGDYDQEAPLMIFDVNCQWIFKSEQCGYKGNIYYNCGKTLNECMARDNVENFGGFPQICEEYLINK